MLLTIHEINQLTKYANDVVAGQMIRNKGIKAAGKLPTPGVGRPYALYNEEDILAAFRDRIERMANKPAPQ